MVESSGSLGKKGEGGVHSLFAVIVPVTCWLVMIDVGGFYDQVERVSGAWKVVVCMAEAWKGAGGGRVVVVVVA